MKYLKKGITLKRAIISGLLTAICLFSSSTDAKSILLEPKRGKIIAGYELRYNPDNEFRHGFSAGIKTFRSSGNQLEDYKFSFFNPYSIGFSFNGLFYPRANKLVRRIDIYEAGFDIGAGIYGKKYLNSLELVIGAARAGVNSRGDWMWTPNVGIDFEVHPIVLRGFLNGYVGRNEQAYGGSLDVGLSL